MWWILNVHPNVTLVTKLLPTIEPLPLMFSGGKQAALEELMMLGLPSIY